jgi:hypothetical protein
LDGALGFIGDECAVPAPVGRGVADCATTVALPASRAATQIVIVFSIVSSPRLLRGLALVRVG